ncbi:phosphoglycerate kinase [Aureococcus anophagefferens]|nr:phosphoglycerate kinase [Aureococcus anophagefferens]
MSLPSSSMMDALTSLWSVDFDLTHSVVALKLARAAFQQPNAPRPVDATAEASATAFAAEAATGRLFPDAAPRSPPRSSASSAGAASSASADGRRRALGRRRLRLRRARPARGRGRRAARRGPAALAVRADHALRRFAGDGVVCDFPRLEDMSRESGSLWRNLLSRLRYVACAARTAPAAPALFVVEILAQDWRDSPADPDHVVASSAARVLGAWATDAFDDDKSFIAGTPGAYYWGRLHVATDGCAPVSRSAGEWPVVAHVASTFADDGDAMRVASLTFAFTGCRRGADDQAPRGQTPGRHLDARVRGS